MRILMITMELPFPPVGGARLRSHQFLEALAGKHEITIVGFTFDEGPPHSALPVEIVGVPWEWPQLYTNSGTERIWEGLDVPEIHSLNVKPNNNGQKIYAPIESYGKI